MNNPGSSQAWHFIKEWENTPDESDALLSTREFPRNLAVGLFVAIRAFHRRRLALIVLRLMAANAEPGGCGRIVEGGLQLRGNRRCSGAGMAIRTSLL